MAYAEILYQWELLDKRAELLKYIGRVPDAADSARKLGGVDPESHISMFANILNLFADVF